MKNKNIFLSQWLVHPHHPFTKWERHFLLFASFEFALGLEMIFCVVFDYCSGSGESDFVSLFVQVIIWKILIGASLNGIYDALIEHFVTCGCFIDRCSRGCIWCIEFLSGVALLALMGFGLIVLLYAVTLVSNMENSSRVVANAVKELVIGKVRLVTVAPVASRSTFHRLPLCWSPQRPSQRQPKLPTHCQLVGACLVCSSLDVVGYFYGRASQMKPGPADLEARKKWDQVS